MWRRIFGCFCQQHCNCRLVVKHDGQFCSKTSLFLFDTLSMRKLEVLSIPRQIRVEPSSTAFLDCVEDGEACLLMSIGKGLLLLWFFEAADESQAASSRLVKSKNASIAQIPSATLPKRHVSIENSPEIEAREGLEGYYSDLDDEHALDRIRSRINPEGFNEEELLQLAIQASLADTRSWGSVPKSSALVNLFLTGVS